jgi:N-acylneuraminate cytidylyltransferase/CMP-N,N'-diacetyllegionaminic acid synthase
MQTLPKILVTICARGGSKGVKNKNIRPLAGRPLIAHTIWHALNWGKAEDVIVSTDSREIAEVAKAAGASVPFLRPAELATDSAPKIPVIQHALRESGKAYDFVLDLDPTAPLRKLADLDNVLRIHREKNALSTFSVVSAHKNPYFNMVELAENGFAHVSKTLAKGIARRQDAPKVYNMNASIYMYSVEYLETATGVFSPRSAIYEMDELSAFDIDRELDFKLVEFFIREGLFQLESFQPKK